MLICIECTIKLLFKKYFALLSIFFCTINISFAQPVNSVEKASSESLIEVVQVTATKRVKSIQEIPMAIFAISDEQLQNNAIANLNDLSQRVPNFYIADGIVTTNVNMRGMGSGGDRAFEQSVGMFADNIYMPRSRQYRTSFFDTARVEILRGPQAVLFGLNSTAGAVNILSANNLPGDDFTAQLATEYETEYSLSKLSAIIGGSPTDSLGARLAFQTSEGDNFIENLSGESLKRDENLGRLSLNWQANNDIQIALKVELADFQVDGSPGELFSGPLAGSNLFGFSLEDGKLNYQQFTDGYSYQVPHPQMDYKLGLDQQSQNYALTFDWQLSDHTITAIYGHSQLQYEFATDLDNSPVPILDAAVTENYRQNSAELRISSIEAKSTGEFDYIVGFYFQDSHLFNGLDSSLNMQFGVPYLTNSLLSCEAVNSCDFAEYNSNDFTVNQQILSFYATGNYLINDQWQMQAGLRYVDEEKKLNRVDSCEHYHRDTGKIVNAPDISCPTFTGAGEIKRNRDEDNFMPELVLIHHYQQGSQLYAKASKSVKAGGYASSSSVLPESLEFDEETATTIELGWRTIINNGSGQIFITAFSTKYDDLQVNSFIDDDKGLPVSTIGNAGEATNQGVEFESYWQLGDYIDIGLSLAYLDAQYDKFKTGACAASSPEAKNGQLVCDQSGQTLAYSPKFSGVLHSNLIYPLKNSLQLTAGISLSYSDAYFTNGTNDKIGKQNAYLKASARLGIEDVDQKWQLNLVINNLTDKHTLEISQVALSNYLGYLSPPRTITLQAKYRWGS